MASYIHGGYNGYTSQVSGWTDASYYGSGATTVDFTQVNNTPGYKWYYQIMLQRLVNGNWVTTDTLAGSFADNVTRSFNITDNLPGDYRVYGNLRVDSTNFYNKTDIFKIYR
ncbi:hypothetical protein OB986_17965 [Bacillus cereus]|uniref:hypothetical protein n=1 Tax=Bacillus cereus group TaxID=86661 RepID=UPI000B43FE00|nr:MULTISPECIES: hypothetical protein [Bacillus cereus group]MCU5063141.1 hypothetical protein [Bacillus cereus]MEB8692940.1 hypothetical protein [Bacillus cereus]OTX80834.1 hypothetical protein BK726_27600 [Bacillus thuringiensis serovar londrina]PFT54340.1 hypothetical protein COK67_29160 [Bacillus cereus]